MSLLPLLLVFIGKPAIGKTTLIRHVFPGAEVIDVKSFVRSYRVQGHVPEIDTARGYEDMYNYISSLKGPCILELGTGHAEMNTLKLRGASDRFHVVAIFCEASEETCKRRLDERGDPYDHEAMLSRIARVFPAEHIGLFSKYKVEYFKMNMEGSLTDSANILTQVLTTHGYHHF